MTTNKRTSGVLLPISALPSQFGVGSMGLAARDFAQKLAQSGQKYWQVLPLSPIDFVYSPYASASAFAGCEMLIDLETLCIEGYFSRAELDSHRREYFTECDYAYAQSVQAELFGKAYAVFCREEKNSAAFARFCTENADWLDDYAFFAALKEHFGGIMWRQWQKEVRERLPSALAPLRAELSGRIEYYKFLQFVFFRQLSALTDYLHSIGVELIGDIPFYVAEDSADTWVNAKQFLLDENMRPTLVAGVPPDFFSADGQLWGNPIYNWEQMRRDGFAWWLKRFAHCRKIYDVVRIDHFRAFDTYYTIDFGQTTARNGRWQNGVGTEFFTTLYKQMPDIRLIAEDLGDIGEGVVNLRRAAALPGMKVLQFAFDSGANNPFLPHNYEPDCVAYLGTHDNNTTRGWWDALEPRVKSTVFRYLGAAAEKAPPPEQVVKLLMTQLSASVAQTVIFTVQDLIGNGADRRINTPSQIGWWKYMLWDKELKQQHWDFLAEISRLFNRA